MKPTLALMFVASLGMGQTINLQKVEDGSHFRNDGTDTLVVVRGNPNNQLVTRSLLYLYSCYEKECRTYVEKYHSLDSGWIARGKDTLRGLAADTCLFDSRYDKQILFWSWKWRPSATKPTFEGFIQFLKRDK